MDRIEEIKKFYLEHLVGAKIKGNTLNAPCPFCKSGSRDKPGEVTIDLDPESLFSGYFNCLNRCSPGGFMEYFAKLMGIDPHKIPGHDPDREAYVRDIVYPAKSINAEMKKFRSLMSESEYAYFEDFGVSRAVVDEMRIGYNGRYMVYPYFGEDGNCYAARCVLPGKEEDNFWYGEEMSFSEEFRIFNVEEIDRCEDGALFITDGENNLLTLLEMGYPGIAVPSFTDLEMLDQERLAFINHIFLLMNNSPEAQLSARGLATKLGFKARILRWPPGLERGSGLCQLRRENEKEFKSTIVSMVKASKSFSPFSSPRKEHRNFSKSLERVKGKKLLGMSSGFEKMDQALNGIRGLNILGAQPKAGKSCFFIQISSEMARNNIPVIYYDFENGRQKIYMRTLCRLSRLSEEEIRNKELKGESFDRINKAHKDFERILDFFRVVTDRKLSPDIMRRQIDFLQHETRKDQTLVVIDSLHKLPFKNLSERRTGIDEWLRNMEAIRDEHNASFLVVSELSRGEGRGYSKNPDLGSFKESGDIEYSADNAMILLPDWDPIDPISSEEKKNTLWLVASRENSPGKIAEYVLEYPFWGFSEK